MKIIKKVWLIIAIGICIIVGISLGVVYFQQMGEQNELDEQLTLLQIRLSGVQLEQISSQQAELEEQLIQASSQLETDRVMLSQSVGSVTVTSVLFDLAKAYDVKVTKVTSPGPITENLEGITYSVIPLTAEVTGGVSNLVSFVTSINSYFATGIVKSVTINVLGTTISDNTTANVELAFYAHEGD
ncbi:hypothetical protein ACFLUJ_07620 [Chloroflexota bacterium]